MAEQVIGHYQIIEKIGAGAMGEVYRAHDGRLGRDVALKLIRPASNANPDHVRRFEMEARAAAGLNHPNIVAVYDVGVHEGSPYIVCELLAGMTLRHALVNGALTTRVAVNYAGQIVQGLIAAHAHRIVHRDLKPENLFVTGDGRVKILDFGVAKLQSSPEDTERGVEQLTTVTRAGAVIGTVAYMSPEQLRAKAVDHRSDIFSVGAILYEMLTGRRAFRGETEVDTMTAVLLEEPSDVNLDEAKVPVACRDVVRHCLEKEPENRFQSARDLAFSLARLADPSGRGTVRLPRKRSRVLPWVLAATLGIAALLLVGDRFWHRASEPVYQRLTFEQGTLYAARFAPDFRAIVYAAAWNGGPVQIFSTVGNSHLTQTVDVRDASLLGVSRSGELAVALHGTHPFHLETAGDILARTPLVGGSPREVLEDVPWADWDAKGDLAVVHHVDGRDRIEYPIGHVLYESKGWITHLRFCPQGDRIAFMDHPLWDDRGVVGMIDAAGHASVITPEWDTEAGLAWSPDGSEVWFSAADKGGSTSALRAVRPGGSVRTILTLPTKMTLQDVAPDGRVLLSLDSERLAMATVAGDGRPSEISWNNWSVAKDVSRDGQAVLFEDASEAEGVHYSLAIRRLDGTPPVELGEGSAGGLSPDGKWAISILPGTPGVLKLIPLGAGQAREIAVPGLESINNGTARFLADGKHITLNGNEAGHAVRCYIVSLDGGKPVPITPEGTTNGFVSPDGRTIVGADSEGILYTYSTNGGPARVIPNLDSKFGVIQWSEDNSYVYGYDRGQVPAKIYKLNIVTGEKTLVRELQADAGAGVVNIAPIVVNPSASRFAYSYYQLNSVLYVVSGLR